MLQLRNGYVRPNSGWTGEELARHSDGIWISEIEGQVFLFFMDPREPTGIEITETEASWLVVEWAQHADFGMYGETPRELAEGMRFDAEMAILHGIPDVVQESRP